MRRTHGGVPYRYRLSCLLISPSSCLHQHFGIASSKRVFRLTYSIDRYLETAIAAYHTRNIPNAPHITPTMLHKRKRSATILSSPTSELSSSGTVQSFYPHTKPTPSPFHSSSKPASFDPDTPSYLNIRTRKRHRDNRPDADAVHGTSCSPHTCFDLKACSH